MEKRDGDKRMNDEELKAMLIIDMPDNCYQCSCLQAEISYETIDMHICGADYHKITELYKRNNCPLKPMPKKLEFKTDRLTLKSNMDEIDNYIKNLGYERVGNIHDTIGGYNACIDEILGEEE